MSPWLGAHLGTQYIISWSMSTSPYFYLEQLNCINKTVKMPRKAVETSVYWKLPCSPQ